MKKNSISLVICCIVLCVLLSGCCIKHDWEEAKCTLPKSCKKCSKMEGEPLGHEWGEATCVRSKTCKRCGKSEGVPLGHKEGKWEVVKKATLMKAGCKQKKCTVCKKVTNTQNITITPGIVGKCFNFEPVDFINYANSHMNDDKYRIDKKETKVSGGYAYSFYEGKLAVGQVVFSVNSKNYVYRITTKSVSMSVSVILATIIARIIDIDLDFQEVPYKVVMNKSYTSNMLKIYINNNTTNNPVYVEPYVKTQTKK